MESVKNLRKNGNVNIKTGNWGEKKIFSDKIYNE